MFYTHLSSVVFLPHHAHFVRNDDGTYTKTCNHVMRSTVAYEIDTEKRTVTFGMSFCSANDAFSRRKGRGIASSRQRTCGVTIPLLKGTSETKDEALKAILSYLNDYNVAEKKQEIYGFPRTWENCHFLEKNETFSF